MLHEPFHISEVVQEEFHYVIFQFLGKIIEDVKVNASDDALDVNWFHLEELKKLPTSPNLDKVVEIALKKIEIFE